MLAYVGKRLKVSLEESVLTVFGSDCNFLLEVSLFAVPYEHYRAIFKDLYLSCIFIIRPASGMSRPAKQKIKEAVNWSYRAFPDLFRAHRQGIQRFLVAAEKRRLQSNRTLLP